MLFYIVISNKTLKFLNYTHMLKRLKIININFYDIRNSNLEWLVRWVYAILLMLVHSENINEKLLAHLKAVYTSLFKIHWWNLNDQMSVNMFKFRWLCHFDDVDSVRFFVNRSTAYKLIGRLVNHRRSYSRPNLLLN